MALSDREQQMLEMMERALVEEDPRFATSMSGRTSPVRRQWIVGGAGVVIGLGLVLVGVNTTMWVGAAGFALMVAAVLYAITDRRHAQATSNGGGSGSSQGVRRRAPRSPSGGSATGSFMDRMEQRWDRRRGDR